jgi:radical SAM protein with 4Fe4S-binding SPASM domain
VHLACTKACNFRCRHCFSSSGNPYSDELTTIEIKRLIDDLAALGCFQLSIGGGEPLVRRDLPNILEYANVRGVSIDISTNAAAATREVIETLEGLRINRFKVSLEGASEDLCDSVRGEPGAFRAARQGIENLKVLHAPISLSRVLMKPNASDLPEFIRMAEELQVNDIVLRTVMPVGRAVDNRDLLLDWQETNHLWDEAVALQSSTKINIVIADIVPINRKMAFRGFGCKCGQLECHVDPRGEVAPSGFLKDGMSAGNIRRQNFKEIWDSGASFTRLRSLPGNPRCRNCKHFRGCRGGCRASAMLRDCDINLPDGNCALAHSGRPEDHVVHSNS